MSDIVYTVWESTEHFKRAVNRLIDPQNRLSAFPPNTVASPHLFKKVAVPGSVLNDSSVLSFVVASSISVQS